MSKLFPKENDAKEAVKRLFDKYGWFHFSVPANTYGGNGVSDRLAVKHGVLFACEVKKSALKKDNYVPKGTPLQEKFLADVRKAGGYGMVVSPENMFALEDLLREIEIKKQDVLTLD